MLSTDRICHLRLLGVGGAGSTAALACVSELAQQEAHFHPPLGLVDLDAVTALRDSERHEFTALNLGSGPAPNEPELEWAALAVTELSDSLDRFLDGAEVLVIAASLGGVVGSGAVVEVARIAREAGLLVLVAVTVPFSFEGSVRRRRAEQALSGLGDCAGFTVIVDSADVRGRLGSGAPEGSCLASLGEAHFNAVRGLVKLALGSTDQELSGGVEMLDAHLDEVGTPAYFAHGIGADVNDAALRALSRDVGEGSPASLLDAAVMIVEASEATTLDEVRAATALVEQSMVHEGHIVVDMVEGAARPAVTLFSVATSRT
jgi:cell division protein FtsZ